MLFGVAMVSVLAASASSSDPVLDKVFDTVDGHFQRLFADLSLVEKGEFGITRVERDAITAHANKSAWIEVPEGWVFNVVIFGNHGKPVTPDKLGHRYARNMNGIGAGMSQRAEAKVHAALAAKALRAWQSGKAGAIRALESPVTFEARPVKLSKRECLKCHSGMKQGDIVAVMVYSAARRDTHKKPPPETSR